MTSILWRAVRLVLVMSLVTAAQADAEKRHALVIAIDGYTSLPTLNTVRQAQQIKDVFANVVKFDEVGWLAGSNVATVAQLRAKVQEFASKVQEGDSVVVYYAGHGIQVNGRNYLLPADYSPGANPQTSAYPADELLSAIAAHQPKMQLLILDACRNNPAIRGAAGLAAMESSKFAPGTRIEFAASAGQVASDEGDFAAALIEELSKPGQSVDDVFTNVRRQVLEKSANQQQPISFSQLTVNFYFTPPDMDPEKALSILAHASESLPQGDIGQTRAVQALIQQGRSLAGTNLQGLSFASAHFGRGDFSRADLTGDDLTGAVFEKAILSQARLSFSSLNGTRLGEAQLERARFTFAYAECIDGKKGCTDFTGAHASNSIWLATKAPGANFTGADLRGARFMFADLRGAHFDKADLSNAFFVASDLRGATFTGATFANTDLTDSRFDRTLGPPQKAHACEIPLSPFGTTSTVSLLAFDEIPNASRDGGVEYDRMLEQKHGRNVLSKGLPACGPRTFNPDEWYPISSYNGRESLSEEVTVRFTHRFLEQPGRREVVRRRLSGLLEFLDGLSR